MIDAPPRYTLHGTVTHYPDDTWTATLQLDDGGRLILLVWTTWHYRTRQDALDAVANRYREDQRLPPDTPVHAATTDKTAGSLTPECADDNCICMERGVVT